MRFPSFKTVKQGVIDALLLHTRHLNDFPTQYGLIVLAGIGMAILPVQAESGGRRCCGWCSPSRPFIRGRQFPQSARRRQSNSSASFFYNDPRRLSAVVTMLATPMAAVAVCSRWLSAPSAVAQTIYQTACARVGLGHRAAAGADLRLQCTGSYMYRHLVLFGDKYDSVIINQKDLDAFAHLAAAAGRPAPP